MNTSSSNEDGVFSASNTHHMGPVNALCRVSDEYIISGGGYGELKLWNCKKGELMRNYKGHDDKKSIFFVVYNAF